MDIPSSHTLFPPFSALDGIVQNIPPSSCLHRLEKLRAHLHTWSEQGTPLDGIRDALRASGFPSGNVRSVANLLAYTSVA